MEPERIPRLRVDVYAHDLEPSTGIAGSCSALTAVEVEQARLTAVIPQRCAGVRHQNGAVSLSRPHSPQTCSRPAFAGTDTRNDEPFHQRAFHAAYIAAAVLPSDDQDERGRLLRVCAVTVRQPTAITAAAT